MINVQGAPAIYQAEGGVLARLPSVLKKEGFQRIIIIHGTKSFEAIKDHLPTLSDFTIQYVLYRGECSEKEVERIKKEALLFRADVLIGIGGGKLMDLVKAVGYQMKKEVILLPTLASTCAAWTPLSVFYTEEGNFTHYTVFPKSTFMVLVEPNVIQDSPLVFFKAGIGDTLAKWYEAKALIHTLDPLPVAVQIGLHSAELSRKIILQEGIRAIRDLERGDLTPSVLAVIDAVIMLGGMVGGFAEYYGRVAAAHSIHNALTHIPNTHNLLHGEKVAYGILVQLALEGNFQEIKKLLTFYECIGLPKNLTDLGLSVHLQKEINQIAEKTVIPSESIHFMKDVFSASNVKEAILEIEKINEWETERAE